MRTTLTLEPDVVRLIEEEVHRQRSTFKEVVNRAIRNGLSSSGRRKKPARYTIPAHTSELVPGIDSRRLNQLADELEDEALVARIR